MSITNQSGAEEMSKSFDTRQCLELACAAQRWNKDYIKEMIPVYADNGEVRFWQQPNKYNILYSLGEVKIPDGTDPRLMPVKLTIEDEDKELADEIQKYFRRLVFAAVKGDNEFQTEVNSLLSSDTVPANKLGYVACLPSVYKRDYARNQIDKRIRTVDVGYLADVGTNIFDLDCEIIESNRSKNFDAYNITAIINNKMVSWFSKVDLKLGPCVVVKAKVKDQGHHWKHKSTTVTRLNYVKAAQ